MMGDVPVDDVRAGWQVISGAPSLADQPVSTLPYSTMRATVELIGQSGIGKDNALARLKAGNVTSKKRPAGPTHPGLQPRSVLAKLI